MATFIVRFLGPLGDDFRGKVRHVASGEESTFASKRDLLTFFEAMNAVCGAAEDAGGREESGQKEERS
ncbi:MAG: hypothetical protein EHM19_06585 [Candidatus Latescibacterota bacterium]|nr:MAG: hypothetical protein EHM19_06585 [Candidatus Latescibacterota bacterium]